MGSFGMSAMVWLPPPPRADARGLVPSRVPPQLHKKHVQVSPLHEVDGLAGADTGAAGARHQAVEGACHVQLTLDFLVHVVGAELQALEAIVTELGVDDGKPGDLSPRYSLVHLALAHVANSSPFLSPQT